MRLIRPFGKYFNEMVVTPADFRAADDNLIGLINGTDGGTWAPTSPIYIAGKGLQVDNAYAPVSPRTRVIKMGVFEYARSSSGNGQWNVNYELGTVTSAGTQSKLWLPVTKIHNGATLSQITAYFTVPTGKTSLPVAYPVLVAWRESPGSGTQYLYSAIGVSYPTPASLGAYINGGRVNSFSLIPDQNNVLDTSTYNYNIVFEDDDLSASPFNSVVGVELTYSNITTYQLP